MSQAEFDSYIAQLPELLERLRSMKPITINARLVNCPEQVVYLFSDEKTGKPLYVGRTDHFRQRMRNHSLPSSKHFQATFAFKIADEIAKLSGTRLERSRHPSFAAAKIRVRTMPLRYIEIADNPKLQLLFETYAAIVLATPYNEFTTS